MPDNFATIGCSLLRYHRWALQRYIAALELLGEEQLLADRQISFGSIHRTLLHLYQADAIWWSRLTANPVQPTPAGEDDVPPLASLQEAWFRLLDGMNIWAGGLSEAGWFAAIEYSNSKGVPFRTPVWQAVLQMVNHGTAHRGQVGALLRQIGVTPPNSDLINFYRLEAA